MLVSVQTTSCVCSSQRTTEKSTLIACKITRFPDQTSMGFTDESRFILDSIWREQRTKYHQCRKSQFRGGGFTIKEGISLGHIDLHVFYGGTLIGVRSLIHMSAAGAIGHYFLLMDNTRPHRVEVVEDYLEGHGLEQMD
ncbi:transposable element Tcb2 transposase [Trichonephila clavipes]|nr:transposable element Tcb2 transposase [Trichonephila clavipes]